MLVVPLLIIFIVKKILFHFKKNLSKPIFVFFFSVSLVLFLFIHIKYKYKIGEGRRSGGTCNYTQIILSEFFLFILFKNKFHNTLILILSFFCSVVSYLDKLIKQGSKLRSGGSSFVFLVRFTDDFALLRLKLNNLTF